MPIDTDDRYLFIANALSFPAAFPELGVVDLGADAMGLAGVEQRVLHFTQTYEEWSVQRTVLASNVSAVFVPYNVTTEEWVQGNWWENGNWLAGSELAVTPSLLRDEIEFNKPDPNYPPAKKAIVYLPEHVGVIMEVKIASLSAAESHQYRPSMLKMWTCDPPC